MTSVVVDTSAAVAILGNEPAAEDTITAMEAAQERLMSAATLVELGIVMQARLGAAGALAVERFLRDGDVTVVALDRRQADRALDGWRRFGKGRDRASLNLGDCFTYALAADRILPVLCTGEDFSLTDLDVLPRRADS